MYILSKFKLVIISKVWCDLNQIIIKRGIKQNFQRVGCNLWACVFIDSWVSPQNL